jgi:NAD+--asparagine ADP-ribosyltransferase
MVYPNFINKYIDDIFMEFTTKCNLKTYFDEDFPIDIHYYKSKSENKKIIMDVYYDADNIYVKGKLDDIKESLSNTAKEWDLDLTSVRIYDTYEPQNKKGGTTNKMMQEMIKYGKNCARYKFIIKPDYTSQKHMN